MASYLYQRVLLISFLRCSNLLQSLMKSSPMILWMRLVLGRKNLEANLSSFLIFYPKQFRNNYSSKEIRMGMYNLLINVARIETEKMLIQMVETELECRKIAGAYKHHFQGQSHFFGYEGRCGLPSNFDSNYCYSLGYAAGALLHSGKTGLISAVGNLNAPVEEWTVDGTALTSLMDVERRHGKFKPVIKKAMVELEGVPFKKFASVRDEWAIKNRYVSPDK